MFLSQEASKQGSVDSRPPVGTSVQVLPSSRTNPIGSHSSTATSSFDHRGLQLPYFLISNSTFEPKSLSTTWYGPCISSYLASLSTSLRSPKTWTVFYRSPSSSALSSAFLSVEMSIDKQLLTEHVEFRSQSLFLAKLSRISYRKRGEVRRYYDV